LNRPSGEQIARTVEVAERGSSFDARRILEFHTLGLAGAEGTQAAATAGCAAGFIAGYQSMNRMNPKVDAFLSKAKKWQKEFEKLRTIVLDCGLTEELKWGQPCYTFEKKNIVLIHGFREYCALLFFKGALLKDARGILIQQTENVQAARQIRFTNVREIVRMEPILKAYIHEAVEVERAGLKVKLKKTSDFKIPEEFQNKLDKIPALKAAFAALTPGRQRAYLFYFSQPKQSKTRKSRVEKYMQQILNGKGLNA
jgi:uncharacterized protein YdeI (YjbR/CyaY-like superfamily)